MVSFRIVLVIEQEPIIRLAAADALANAGFQVIEVRDSTAAIVMLEICATGISAVVANIAMPGPMNGMDLVRHAHGRWPWIRVLVTSGLGRPSAKDMPPGSLFLPKPYMLPDMVAKVRELSAG